MKLEFIELTTLIVPKHNDSVSDMENEAKWIASIDKNIPLHITRYFPMYKETTAMTPLETMDKLITVAKKYLNSVYEGNI